MVGIERQVGGARLERGENRHDHRGRAIETYGHPIFGSDAVCHEEPSEAIRTSVEFAVGHLLVAVDHRYLVPCACRLTLEEFDECRL